MPTVFGMPRVAVPAPTVSDEEALELWQYALDPDNVGLAEAIAADIASFTDEPIEVVLRRMAEGLHRFKELWRRRTIDARDPESVAGFYREQFEEAYELANWHCGRANGAPPLNYARAALFARANGLRRVLDFGSGIGSGSLAFAKLGCEIHSADVARTLLQFVEHRFRRQRLTPRLLDLNATQPREGYFDLITAFDVLEHIPDQLATIRRLQSYLRVGGYLLVNLMADSSDEDRPMHVSSAGDWLRMMRRTALAPDWMNCTGQLQTFVYRRSSRLRNLAGTCTDWLEGR